MNYQTADFQAVLYRICAEIDLIQPELTEIDSKLGDGDLGMSMTQGAAALRKMAQTPFDGTPGQFFLACAAAFNRAAPSTLGTLLSSAMRSAGKAWESDLCWSEYHLVSLPEVFACEISRRGKAQEGDKTILDALIPYANTLKSSYHKTQSLTCAARAAARAAQDGAEQTRGMEARTGRARWLSGRNREYPDGGAVLFARIAGCLADLAEDGIPR